MKKIILLGAVVTNTCFAAYDCKLEVSALNKGKTEIASFYKSFPLYVPSIDKTSTLINEDDFNLSAKEFPERQSLVINFNNSEKMVGYIRLPFVKELKEINYTGSFMTGKHPKSNINFIGLKCTKK